MEKIRIRDKHPGSATLIETNIAASVNEMHGFYYEFQDTLSAAVYCCIRALSNTLPLLWGCSVSVDINAQI
jgi:hypothetical protein